MLYFPNKQTNVPGTFRLLAAVGLWNLGSLRCFVTVQQIFGSRLRNLGQYSQGAVLSKNFLHNGQENGNFIPRFRETRP